MINNQIEKSFIQCIKEHIDAFNLLNVLLPDFQKAVDICVIALSRGNKLMFCGNGGSAADAQHLSAEFVGRFIHDRKALAAISLTTDTSALTCVGNDYGFHEIFSRQVEGIGLKGDVLIAISTSGRSQNVVQAVTTAQNMKITTIALTGSTSSELSEAADVVLHASSQKTALIQEIHIFLGHMLCLCVEEKLLQTGGLN